MSLFAKRSAECFAENLNHYVNHQTEAEKYNHYTGLLSMAQALEELSGRVQRLDAKLDLIIQALSQSR